ncbi:MAG: dihydroorotate dehydrogenase-like protein, partial [Anaerolineae bacterium]
MDLSTTYMGLKLKNPIVPSSSPLTRKRDTMRQMEDAGAAAVVLYSLFEEQITLETQTLDQYLIHGADSFAEAVSYFPQVPEYQARPDAYLEHIQWAKRALDIPIIASLNGVSSGGWIRYAQEIESAGADALELNVYYLPTDLTLSGGDVEQIYLDILHDVKASVTVSVAMKMSPYFSAFAHMAKALADAGADGLSLFNRFYQPDLDPENLEVVPNLMLSHSHEMRLPMRWIAILYGRIAADLGLTTGIHTVQDVIKGVMAGASVTMMASELLQNGVGRITAILNELEQWLVEHEYESLSQMHGSLSQINCAEPAAFERANYMRVLSSF